MLCGSVLFRCRLIIREIVFSFFRWFMIKRKHDRLQPFVDSHEHCREVAPVRRHGLMFNPPTQGSVF